MALKKMWFCPCLPMEGPCKKEESHHLVSGGASSNFLLVLIPLLSETGSGLKLTIPPPSLLSAEITGMYHVPGLLSFSRSAPSGNASVL